MFEAFLFHRILYFSNVPELIANIQLLQLVYDGQASIRATLRMYCHGVVALHEALTLFFVVFGTMSSTYTIVRFDVV